MLAFGEQIGWLIGIGLAIALAGGCLAAAQGRRRTAAGALPAFGAALCFGFMFALFAAAEDLGPVSRRRRRPAERPRAACARSCSGAAAPSRAAR